MSRTKGILRPGLKPQIKNSGTSNFKDKECGWWPCGRKECDPCKKQRS